MSRKKCTLESIGITTLKQGQFFYSHKPDKDITAISHYYRVRVGTERLIIINPQTCKAQRITKITIL
jgi:hypothetical protein